MPPVNFGDLLINRFTITIENTEFFQNHDSDADNHMKMNHLEFQL